MSVLTQILPSDVDVIGEPRGFLRGTQLMTPDGWRMVQTLKPGDVVSCCRDQPVVVSRVTRAMVVRPGVKVVAVAGEARGRDRASTPLLLPVGQMIVVAGESLAAYFGVEEALAPVGALVNGQDLRLIDGPPADIWYEIETVEACALVVEGLQVAVGQAGRDSRPVLSMAEARLLSLAA